MTDYKYWVLYRADGLTALSYQSQHVVSARLLGPFASKTSHALSFEGTDALSLLDVNPEVVKVEFSRVYLKTANWLVLVAQSLPEGRLNSHFRS